MSPPLAGPSLDQLAAAPECARDLSPAAALDLLAQLAPLQTVLLARAVAAPVNGHGPETPGNRLLDVGEAAKVLNVSPDWLYRRAGKLPFAVRLGHLLRFSSHGIERYIQQRAGR